MFVNITRTTTMNMDKGQDTVTMLSLQEYELMATKLVLKHITNNGLRHEILNNEDAISDLMHVLAKADLKFDGRGTREGYRSDCAKFFFRHYIAKKSKVLKKNINCDPSTNTHGETIFDLIPAKGNAVKQSDDQETIAFLFSKIPASWQEILTARHIEGKTLQEIADDRGMSKERVRQIINKAEAECKLLLS